MMSKSNLSPFSSVQVLMYLEVNLLCDVFNEVEVVVALVTDLYKLFAARHSIVLL
jgi:hypothetical protein